MVGFSVKSYGKCNGQPNDNSHHFLGLWKWVLVTQSHWTLCHPMDCSPPGSSVCGILQARILEWIAVLFSRESSQPWNQTQVSHIAGGFFTIWASGEVILGLYYLSKMMWSVLYIMFHLIFKMTQQWKHLGTHFINEEKSSLSHNAPEWLSSRAQMLMSCFELQLITAFLGLEIMKETGL